MKHHLCLLLAAVLGAISIGAAAAVHDWTATRIGAFDAEFLGVVGMNNAGQVAAFSAANPGGENVRSFLYTPGSAGGLVDLGTFGATQAGVNALNASGQVVGSASFPGYDWHGFIYQNGRMRRLGLPGEASGIALDINDHGQVLLQSTAPDNVRRGAIVDPGGSATVLNVPGDQVVPIGINNRGQVAGIFSTPAGLSGFRYDNGRMTDIGSLGGTYTVPVDINKSGQIVGHSSKADTDATTYPFLYSDGRMTEIGGAPGQALDINDRGQVVGSMNAAPGFRGFLYGDGRVIDPGDLGGDYVLPFAINELGQALGVAEALGDVRWHAFFYSDGKMTDLTEWLRTSFSDVASVSDQAPLFQLNDLGQIAIGATLTNGQQTLFVLTPIPEPSTYALMLSGLGVLAWIARRQRAARKSTGASSCATAAISPMRATL